MGRNHLQEQQVPKDPTIYSPGHATRRDHRVLASVSRGYPRLKGSLITSYSPVRHFTRLATFTCDLHASSTPPTFVLSQDQTLHLKCWIRPVSTYGFRRRWLATPVPLTQHGVAIYLRSHARLRGHPVCQRSPHQRQTTGARARVPASCGARKGSEARPLVKASRHKNELCAQDASGQQLQAPGVSATRSWDSALAKRAPHRRKPCESSRASQTATSRTAPS